MTTPYDQIEAGLLAEDVPGDNSPALSVSELSGALKRTVEDRFGHVRVRGEISGFMRHTSGHCYLTLKDDKAAIDGVIWKGQAGSLRFRPEDGAEVIATGKLTTYPGRSKYQIVIDRMELAGQGALMALLDKRRRMLAAEGLFDEGRKQGLPFLPRTIGVVTSPTGAVIRDILHRLADRFPSHVLVWPVPVQGEGAAQKVAAAVRGFDALEFEGRTSPLPHPASQSDYAVGGRVGERAGAATPPRRPDLVIVARGGGSIEDLWAFNEEVVVRAVAECRIPVISAVGHETDTTLCDFAADRRAPTPTAAAEMAVPVRGELLAYVETLGGRSTRCVRRYGERAGERLAHVARRLPSPDALLGPQRQKLDDLAERLPRGLSRRLAEARGDLAEAAGALRPRLLSARVERESGRLALLSRDLDRAIAGPVAQAQARLAGIWRVAESLSPQRVLERGYARVEADGQTIADVEAAKAAGAMRVVFADGGVDVVVAGGGAPAKPRPKAAPSAQPRLL